MLFDSASRVMADARETEVSVGNERGRGFSQIGGEYRCSLAAEGDCVALKSGRVLRMSEW